MRHTLDGPQDQADCTQLGNSKMRANARNKAQRFFDVKLAYFLQKCVQGFREDCVNEDVATQSMDRQLVLHRSHRTVLLGLRTVHL